MKLNIDKCLSFIGSHAWFFIFGAVSFQIISMVVLARSFFVDAFLDTAIIAAAIQMVAIIFMAVSRHAVC